MDALSDELDDQYSSGDSETEGSEWAAEGSDAEPGEIDPHAIIPRSRRLAFLRARAVLATLTRFGEGMEE
jgi:hypothetical protein